MLIPIYQEQKRTYEADTCGPVAQAAQAGQLRHVALVRGHYPGRRLPRNALPGVKVVGFWDADHRQDWGLDWHRNEGIELTFLESGRLAFAVEDQQFQHSRGRPLPEQAIPPTALSPCPSPARRERGEGVADFGWRTWLITTSAILQVFPLPLGEG